MEKTRSIKGTLVKCPQGSGTCSKDCEPDRSKEMTELRISKGIDRDTERCVILFIVAIGLERDV